MLPIANAFLDEPTLLHDVGIDGTNGLVHVGAYGSDGEFFKTTGQITYYETWNNLWKTKWTAPYSSRTYEHGAGIIGSLVMQTYWLFSVIERAGSTDLEKIIKVWEGDTYQFANGKVVQMRPADHKVAQDLHVEIYVPPDEQGQNFNISPYYWFLGASYVGPSIQVPRDKILPLIDPEIANPKIDDILDSIDEWTEGEDPPLYGIGKGNSADNRLNVLENMLQNAKVLFNEGDINGACDQIMDASLKCDGQQPPPDFVAGDAAQDLHEMISVLMTDFGCE